MGVIYYWNILSFNPKTTDVDEHIDLINTLGDMVDQKEEAKKEKFIETMPTMIQTHLIMCKDWAAVKDTAKSLEHIILKYKSVKLSFCPFCTYTGERPFLSQPHHNSALQCQLWMQKVLEAGLHVILCPA